ncbi:hypothetical protein GCM10007301_45290 [Azorhizobium oxalatiphilum]|uniref:Glycosyl transferase family 1 domain-containing protein n=2 Tax=Azorhizobium oxalatiphilum TaxID=980631 RepID=A0A917FHU8_9HYPH|nr:hypothetical protein GCM10007301_45290 [Azorhizobium oxalatiphilum]
MDPAFDALLVCDSRLGTVRAEAMAGLTWTPEVIYAPVSQSYDPPEPWPTVRDPEVRLFIDGAIVAAEIDEAVITYRGPTPERAFVVLSRAAVDPAGTDGRKRGIRLKTVTIESATRTSRVAGTDRRLQSGFLSGAGRGWTDGAGFIPLEVFAGHTGDVTLTIVYEALSGYALDPGPGANMLVHLRRLRLSAERHALVSDLALRLKEAGCHAYMANHFTPLIMPEMVNVAWGYDMIPVLFPHYFNPDARINFQNNIKVFSAADRIYAISDCTRADMIEHGKLEPDQVISSGISVSPGISARSSAEVDEVIVPLGLRRKGYIIAVATVEPRKNHLRLLRAYRQMRSQMADCPDLVIVGKMGWGFDRVLSYRHENGMEDCVKVLSDRTEHELSCLYSGALFSAYVSVYEGFGLPILESMVCGCPVLTSDRSSMVEVAGGAARLVDPYDVQSIALALQEMSQNAELRGDLIALSRARTHSYSWQRSAGIIVDDLRMLADQS